MLLADGLAERGAAQALTLQKATPDAFAQAFRTVLSDPAWSEAMLDRACHLVPCPSDYDLLAVSG